MPFTFTAKTEWINPSPNKVPDDVVTVFSRSKIIKNINHRTKEIYPASHYGAINVPYTFDKEFDKDDKRRFKISISNNSAYLNINWWNKIKCNYIHHRYYIDREKEWFIKTIIASAIGMFMGVLGAYLGYNLGYRNGINQATKAQQSLPQQVKQLNH